MVTGYLTSREGEVTAGKGGAVLMVGLLDSSLTLVSVSQVTIMYRYKDKHTGSADFIMTGKEKGMEDEEGCAVSLITLHGTLLADRLERHFTF